MLEPTTAVSTTTRTASRSSRRCIASIARHAARTAEEGGGAVSDSRNTERLDKHRTRNGIGSRKADSRPISDYK